MFSKPGQIDSRFFVVRTVINSFKKRMIGTSGFIGSKREWVNAASFPEHGPTCLEVNSSFYRVPSPKIIDSLRALPSNPKFVFKVHKRITHQKKLSDAQTEWFEFYNAISPLVGEGRVGCVLFQMPPSFAKSPKNLSNLSQIASLIPDSLPCAIEFRNRSWLCEEVYELCRGIKWCIVSTYITKRESNDKWMGSMPPGLYKAPSTSSLAYVRIHGKKGFRGALTGKQMQCIIDLLRERHGDEHFVMFNNVFYDNRVKNEVKMPGIQYAAISDAMRLRTRYNQYYK